MRIYIQYENTEIQAKYIMLIKKDGNDIRLCHFGTAFEAFQNKFDQVIDFFGLKYTLIRKR